MHNFSDSLIKMVESVLEMDVLNDLPKVFTEQKQAFAIHRSEPLGMRIARLKKLKTWLLENRSELHKAVFLDFGKPATEVDTSELFPVLGEISTAIDNLKDWVSPRKVDAPITYIGTRAEIRYEPKGICLILSPWNYPFNLSMGPLVSCLAAGNTAIIKPSEFTPHTNAFIKTLVDEVFDPKEVFLVEGDASVAGELLKLPFDHIFFTGSPAVGKIVMRAAAENLSSITLELGGKSPVIIDATANLKDAARRIAFGKFFNNGQTCIAPDYVLIDRSVRHKFVNHLKESIAELFGQGGVIQENSPDYARIIHKKHFQHLHRLVDDAIEKGAQPQWMGKANEATCFFPPLILTDVSGNAIIMQEEVFGPVLPLLDVDSMEEAVRIVNERPKPLAMYIFSHDRRTREQVITAISTGGVCVNDCVIQFAHPNLPFGGVNNSGFGKSHGHFGFMAFSNEKPVLRQKSGFANSYLFYPPYTEMRRKLIDFVIRWMA